MADYKNSAPRRPETEGNITTRMRHGLLEGVNDRLPTSRIAIDSEKLDSRTGFGRRISIIVPLPTISSDFAVVIQRRARKKRMRPFFNGERVKSKTVAILTTLGVQLLEVSGSLDVFADAGVQAGTDIYQLRAFSNLPGAIRSSSGVRLMTDAIIGNNLSGKIDTQLVPGAPNLTEASLDARLIGWLRNVIPSVRWYGSICSGAFLLAKAGVLSGQPVTTHGAVADRLAQELGSNTVCPPETGDPSGVVGSKIPRSYEAVDWER